MQISNPVKTTIIMTVFAAASSLLAVNIVFYFMDVSGKCYLATSFLSVMMPLCTAPIVTYKYYKMLEEITLSKEKLELLTQYDTLTQIYSKSHVSKMAQKQLQLIKNLHLYYAVVIITVDDFQKVNENLGHESGDYILFKVSRILKNSLESNDILGRFGGAEFILFLPYLEKRSLVEKIKDLMNLINCSKLINENYDNEITTSAGVKYIKKFEKDMDLDLLIQDASEYALKAKKSNQETLIINNEVII